MLRSLQKIQLYENSLTGAIPLEIWKIQTLEVFLVYNNSLSGELPTEITHLRHLRNVSLFGNRFSGIIPQTLGINSSLEQLDFTNNQFSGEIPPHLCYGKRLKVLDLGVNQLQGIIPSDVGSCSTLVRLILQQNNLSGSLPGFILNTNLVHMDINSNNLNGRIPPSLGNCRKIGAIDLSKNRLSGRIPPQLGDLVELQRLDLSSNRLQGPLPQDILKLVNLSSLSMGFNFLNGSIPSSLRKLTQLSSLMLSENQFTGVPDFMPELERLSELHLGGNFLGGIIPSSLGMVKNLMYVLNLSSNGLSGHLPPVLGGLNLLQKLDISSNNLSGSLTVVSEFHSLIEANVSNNRFQGPIPEPLLKLLKSSSSSFTGNSGLCVPCQVQNGINYSANANFRISPCDCKQPSSDRKGLNSVAIILIVLGGTLFCVVLVLFLGCIIMSRKRSDEGVGNEGPSSLLDRVMVATEHLNEAFIIGRGAHGTVYKVSLDDGKSFALKRIVFTNEGLANSSMVREIKTLGLIKHRNLIKLEKFWVKKDEGFILYDYMENGSLHDVLHLISPTPSLTWEVRFGIAMGTAQGLVYLHDDCDIPIVHKDIKPQNILLDSEMEPHISDFGIAKLLNQSDTANCSTSVMGTPGYIAPEAAFMPVETRESDVYSYGVVLLELITRKKALDPMFLDNMDIVVWVHSTWTRTEDIDTIVDPSLIEECMNLGVVDKVTKVLMVALQCTENNPRSRPTMRDVVKKLEDAKPKEQLQSRQR